MSEVYYSIQDIHYTPRYMSSERFMERARGLRETAELWEAWGFHSNASFWQKEADIAELDAYVFSVYYEGALRDEEKDQRVEQAKEEWRKVRESFKPTVHK